MCIKSNCFKFDRFLAKKINNFLSYLQEIYKNEDFEIFQKMPVRNARSRGQQRRAARRALNQNQNPENVAAARREEVREQNNQLRR